MSGSNAGKRVVSTTPGPWTAWKTKDRHARAIRFAQELCRPPKGYGHGKPMVLAKFQLEWLEEVLAPGITAAAMEVPRGNGKSTLLAAVALWALFDGDDEAGAPQVPIVATTLNQALRSVYQVGHGMVKAEPALMDRVLVYTGIGTQKMVTPHNGGEMFPVSNDPDGLQGLDPSLAVCDEIGFMPIESWDSLQLASGKRPRSLIVGIGTPGFDRTNALWHLRSRVLEGAILPGFHFVEFAADEGCAIDDEEQWRKANPALEGGYKSIDAMRTAVALSPDAHFRIFQLGQWIEGVACWLGDDGRKKWDALVDVYEPSATEPTFVGIDVALKHDSTAVVCCQRRPDGRVHAWAKIWQPRPDGRLDVSDAMEFVRDLGRRFNLSAIAYDPRFFDLPAQLLVDEGFPMLEFPQVLERLVPAVGGTYEAIMRGDFSHNGEVDFTAQVLNAVARFNERGFTLAKSKSRDRIDGAVALCMAHSLAAVRPSEPFIGLAMV